MGCSSWNRHRLPTDWVFLIRNKIIDSEDRDSWADYNCAYKGFKAMDRGANDNAGLFCEEDIIIEPDIDDYTDLDSAREACEVEIPLKD